MRRCSEANSSGVSAGLTGSVTRSTCAGAAACARVERADLHRIRVGALITRPMSRPSGGRDAGRRPGRARDRRGRIGARTAGPVHAAAQRGRGRWRAPPISRHAVVLFAMQKSGELVKMRSHEEHRVQDPRHPGLERTFALLDVLASYQDPVSLKVISEQTGLHPSTAHRILNDLAIGRFVDRPEAGSYRLGMRLLELGNLVKARLDVRDAALGPMRELHKLTHQPVNLSMRQGDEIVYIERTYSERSGMQVVRAIGGAAPLHLTSVGKLFLAHDDPQRVRAYATRTGLAGHTRNSITTCARSSASCRRCSSTARRATTRSWNWACAAWPPASSTTRASWWPGCRSRPRPIGSRKAGSIAEGDRGADLRGARPPRLTRGRGRHE
jgi:DNA-binding IclR family transcriptional regulator